LTYAVFHGSLLFCPDLGWQLLLFRFLAALGIGGEWAWLVLLAETGRAAGVLAAAVLQTAANIGVLSPAWPLCPRGCRSRDGYFLVACCPALFSSVIRRAVRADVEGGSAWSATSNLLSLNCSGPDAPHDDLTLSSVGCP